MIYLFCLLEGNRIIKLHRSHESGSYDIYFNYDENGEIIGLSSEGKEYFYVRDITGNIIKIIDEDGSYVVQYDYNAWSNFNKTIYVDCYVSHRNPFVYKGYFFDEETGLFYLKSRYYNPCIRRFINADGFSYLDNESLNGINLYSYCYNNPIMYNDSSGCFALAIFGISIVVAKLIKAIAIVVLAVVAITTVIAIEEKTHAISNTFEKISDELEELKKIYKTYLLHMWQH